MAGGGPWSMAATADRLTTSQMPPWMPGGGHASQSDDCVRAAPAATLIAETTACATGQAQ